MGPDVRWVGTESGYGRETEWSVLPDIVSNADSIAASSQQYPVDGAFSPADLTGSDLGSRDKLKDARALSWYPAETDVSIRPGWFYHAAEDNRVKSPEKLVDIYFHSVGMNSVLLLNIPPDKRGLIHENDIRSLQGMKKILDETFRLNLLEGTAITVGKGYFEYALKQKASFNTILVQEDIKVGQRIGKFHFEAWDGTAWKTFAGGTTVGHRRILRFPMQEALKIRFFVDESRGEPAIMNIGLFKGPEIEEPVKTVRKIGGTVTPGTEYSPRYTGGGKSAVIDGIRGSYEFTDGRWQGYEGNDFMATIDLGKPRPVSKIWAGFLQQHGSWIFMPQRVEFFVSTDGLEFTRVAIINNSLGEKDEGVTIRDFKAAFKKKKVRYIRILAVNRGVCPDWHAGAGQKAWIFIDEAGVN
jgi:hypothetical protein